jgi:L-aminopeptidase/D-esterase-like protein
MTSENDTLTAVAGLEVGHATVPGGRSGCTVVLGPFRAVAEVRGGSPGSRELPALEPEHLVPRVDALLLTGGGAFGLGVTEGVVSWLETRGRGFETPAARVPIVPAAVIYDLVRGAPRPGPAEGHSACEDASDEPVRQGRVGAGAGASVGRLAGPSGQQPGGVGSAALRVGPHVVGALAVVNAVGDVLDREGRILAGARGGDGAFLDSHALLLGRTPARPVPPRPGEATTLCVVATDAPLSRVDLLRVVRMAGTALARRISPVHTPYDGDLVFGVSTGEEGGPPATAELLALGAAGREVLELAIERAVS